MEDSKDTKDCVTPRTVLQPYTHSSQWKTGTRLFWHESLHVSGSVSRAAAAAPPLLPALRRSVAAAGCAPGYECSPRGPAATSLNAGLAAWPPHACCQSVLTLHARQCWDPASVSHSGSVLTYMYEGMQTEKKNTGSQVRSRRGEQGRRGRSSRRGKTGSGNAAQRGQHTTMEHGRRLQHGRLLHRGRRRHAAWRTAPQAAGPRPMRGVLCTAAAAPPLLALHAHSAAASPAGRGAGAGTAGAAPPSAGAPSAPRPRPRPPRPRPRPRPPRPPRPRPRPPPPSKPSGAAPSAAASPERGGPRPRPRPLQAAAGSTGSRVGNTTAWRARVQAAGAAGPQRTSFPRGPLQASPRPAQPSAAPAAAAAAAAPEAAAALLALRVRLARQMLLVLQRPHLQCHCGITEGQGGRARRAWEV